MLTIGDATLNAINSSKSAGRPRKTALACGVGKCGCECVIVCVCVHVCGVWQMGMGQHKETHPGATVPCDSLLCCFLTSAGPAVVLPIQNPVKNSSDAGRKCLSLNAQIGTGIVRIDKADFRVHGTSAGDNNHSHNRKIETKYFNSRHGNPKYNTITAK